MGGLEGSGLEAAPGRAVAWRRRAAGARRPQAARTGAPDLGTLFAPVLAKLVEDTGAEGAVAWMLQPGDGARRVASGEVPEDAPGYPVLQTLFELGAARDLREPGLPSPLGEYGRKCGYEAAVPLIADEPIGAIFLRAPSRPRTLALLGQAAERLAGPGATALRVDQLAGVEAELARMARLANLGDLLAETVHEIRNPLVSVKTFLQLLPENLEDPDFHTHFREQVVEEVRRMERLLDGVLEQARPGALDSEEDARSSVGGVLASVARLLEKRALEKQLKLVVDLGPDLPEAAIDEDALRQVILNLTLNAFEASPEGGCVRLAAAAGGEGLRVHIDDQGPGVPEEERKRLFDAFYSTRADRPVGLGLAVCRRLVEGAGGSIRVEGAPGESGGARFRIGLPAA